MYNKLALIYTYPDGRLERAAEINVEKTGLRIGVYVNYDASEVSSSIPEVVDGIRFWIDPQGYRSALFHQYSHEGMPFNEGTLLVRWATANIQPATTEQKMVTKLPPQEMPHDRSHRIPTRGQIGYRQRRYYDHER